MAFLPLVRRLLDRHDRPMNIEILLYEGFDELDAIGPYETLQVAAAAGAEFDVRMVTLTPVPVITAARGTRLEPQGMLTDAPGLLIVPGGGWIDRGAHGARAEYTRGDLPRAIAARHAAGSMIAAVCTGAMLLAGAGILTGRPATTHHGAIEDLRAAGANVMPDSRVVDDGDIVTAGGITSGIDLALWIIERERGRAAADQVAEELEHRRSGEVWRSGLPV
jgi:transcriptional regulator GlxA family with amidase domain